MSHERRKFSLFPSTRWSLVGRAAASDDLTRQEAISELLVTYMPGLRAFLIKSRRIPPDLADDLLQGFIADKVLGAGLVGHADQGRGKFRNFVLKSLSNYATTRLQKEYAERKLVVGSDEKLMTSIRAGEETDLFEQEWIKQLVQDALRLMEADCRNRGRTDMWKVFQLRVVEPLFGDAEPAHYEQIIQQFGLKTPREAINLLANAKRCFTKNLRLAVGKYVDNDEDIEAEISDLLKTISG